MSNIKCNIYIDEDDRLSLIIYYENKNTKQLIMKKITQGKKMIAIRPMYFTNFHVLKKIVGLSRP